MIKNRKTKKTERHKTKRDKTERRYFDDKGLDPYCKAVSYWLREIYCWLPIGQYFSLVLWLALLIECRISFATNICTNCMK